MNDRDNNPTRPGASGSGVPPLRDADALPSAEAVRSRQKSRARIMAILLGLFVILVFAISIVKIQIGAHG